MRFSQSLRLSVDRNHFETVPPSMVLLLGSLCFLTFGCEQADLFLPTTDRQNTGSLQIGHTAPQLKSALGVMERLSHKSSQVSCM